MEQYVLAFIIIEIKYSVISRPKFPYIIFQMLGDIGWEIGPVFSKQVNVEDNLVVLNTSIFVVCALYTQRF